MKSNFSHLSSSDHLLEMLGLQMKPSSARRVGTYAGFVVAGVLVGAGVALLLAPKSGRQLRGDLRVSAKELSNHVAATASSAVDSAKRTAHDLRGERHADGVST